MIPAFVLTAALAASSLAAPCQKADISGISLPDRPLRWADWNFLHTTDTHGYQAGGGKDNDGLYSANWADWTVFVRDMKRKAEAMDVEMFVVDSGDIHDGSALADNVGDLVNGVYSTPMIQKTDYDVLALGNHELYVENVARDMHDRFGPAWGGKYLTSNTYIARTSELDAAGKPTSEFIPISDKFRYFEGTKGTKVLSFGWMFNFTNGITKFARVKPIVQEVREPWFAETLNKYKDADFILMAGHATIRDATGLFPSPPNSEWMAAVTAIRAILPDTPIVIFGGHRHSRDYITFGPNTYAIASGRYMETVGFLSLSKTGTVSRRYLNANVPTFNYHLGRPLDFALGQNNKLGREINELIEIAKVKTNYSVVYGCAPQDYFLNRVPPTDPKSIFSFLGKELSSVIGGKSKAVNPPYVIVNGGGQRYDVFAGEFTVADAFNVLPFRNVFRSIKNVPYSVVKVIKATLDPIRPPRRRNLPSNDPVHFVPRADEPTCPYKLGLVTKDNGTAIDIGDDTLACPFPSYPYPNYVYSPSTLPADAQEDALWDLVFYDFIEKTIIIAIDSLVETYPALKGYTVVDYVDKSFSSLVIWPTIASTLPSWKC
ncbi:hypothetical protein HDU67_003353 [Dinochytrium kinnereticum]|nr:hypothetical protein HDU67_003353 [Dinochytrium kinnereticum]